MPRERPDFIALLGLEYASQMEWLWKHAPDATWAKRCVVTRETPIALTPGKGKLHFGLGPDPEHEPYLAGVLTVTGDDSDKPDAEILGAITLYHTGRIDLWWGSSKAYEFDPDHQEIHRTTIWATADDGTSFRIWVHHTPG